MGALFWKYSFTVRGSSSLTHPAPLMCSRNLLIKSPGLQGSQQGTPRALLHPRLSGGIDHGEWKRKMFCQRHLAGSAGEHGHVPAILDLPTALTSRSGLEGCPVSAPGAVRTHPIVPKGNSECQVLAAGLGVTHPHPGRTASTRQWENFPPPEETLLWLLRIYLLGLVFR